MNGFTRFFIGFWGVYWLEVFLIVSFDVPWQIALGVPVAVAILCVIGFLLAGLVLHCGRIQHERKAAEARRARDRKKKIAALIRNAETQNEYLHNGLVDEDQQKINLGVYGEYQPVELDDIVSDTLCYHCKR